MQEPDQMESRTTLLTALFQGLQGTWVLNRKLQSADPSEPSGRCSGKATFTNTQPSPVIDHQGKLQIADAELLYHEQGEFEMAPLNPVTGQDNVPKFSFSRKYIWRLQKAENAFTISVWFTKPGTNAIDYLFHKIDIAFHDLDASSSDNELVLHGSGGHLCVDDFYSSSYSFNLSGSDISASMLTSWTTLHEVRGPKKDQIIETTFTRPE